MKVFVSIDMEGVAGLAHLQQVMNGSADYPESRRLMTEEANAAVAGAFDGGATAVVIATATAPCTTCSPSCSTRAPRS